MDWQNKQEVLQAVSVMGSSLEFVKPPLNNDRDIVIAALKNDPLAIKYASPEFQNDPKFLDEVNDIRNITNAIEMVKKDGLALKFLPEHLKNNYEVCMAAVTNNGLALQYVPKELRENEVILKKALKENGLAIEFVPERKITKEMAILAVKENGKALKLLPKKYKQDKDVIKLAKGDNIVNFKPISVFD